MTPLDDASGSSHDSKHDELAAMFSTLFKHEISKYICGKGVEEHASYANTIDFAGTTSVFGSFTLSSNSWILDTGASSHMWYNTTLLHNIHIMSTPTKIHLSNSSVHIISTCGTTTLHPAFILSPVLFVPTFRFNLISVNKLLHESNLSLTFLKHCCVIQDQKSKCIIAVAVVKGNLYILDKYSFHSDVINSLKSDFTNATACNALLGNESSSSLWHQRMGHCPLSVLSHITSLMCLVMFFGTSG